MSNLNNADPKPPAESREKLEKAEEESRKLDSPERKNDSTVAPEQTKEESLKGFHGG